MIKVNYIIAEIDQIKDWENEWDLTGVGNSGIFPITDAPLGGRKLAAIRQQRTQLLFCVLGVGDAGSNCIG